MSMITPVRTVFVALAALSLASCGINSVPAAEETAKAKWADVEAAFQERANLTEVIEARASATRPEVQIDAEDLDDPAKVQAYQNAQNEFSGALSRLLVSVEAYPELRSQENFGRFMTQFEGSENRIRVAIRDYNEAVRAYNTEIRTFPSIIGAKIIHGAEPLTPYEAATEGAEVAPTLDMRAEGGAAPAASANDNQPADTSAAAAAN